MNELEKNRLAQVIYSPEYFIQWRRIALASKQFEANDIAQQAAIYVFGDWAEWFDMANVEHWNLLKDELFRLFMRSTDRAVKVALRFDHSFRNDLDASTHPALLQAKASATHEPLQQLLDAEEYLITQKKQTKHIAEHSFSMILAYIELFERLKSKTDKHTYLNIAAEMKMSYSWLRQCLNRAEKFLKIQPSLFDGIEYILATDTLESWRRVKIIRDSKPTPMVLVGQLNLF